MLAIGPQAGNQQTGTGPVLMVATGKIAETELAACVRGMVGQGGGDVTAKTVAGHTLYVAKDGNRTMYFAFGRPDTVLLVVERGLRSPRRWRRARRPRTTPSSAPGSRSPIRRLPCGPRVAPIRAARPAW